MSGVDFHGRWDHTNHSQFVLSIQASSITTSFSFASAMKLWFLSTWKNLMASKFSSIALTLWTRLPNHLSFLLVLQCIGWIIIDESPTIVAFPIPFFLSWRSPWYKARAYASLFVATCNPHTKLISSFLLGSRTTATSPPPPLLPPLQLHYFKKHIFGEFSDKCDCYFRPKFF